MATETAPTERTEPDELNLAADGERSPRLRRWEVVTVLLLVLGYSGYYLCRANFSVAKPLIIAEMAAHGMASDSAKVALGNVASWGTLAYAFGKFLSGRLSDTLGGRTTFLTGMAGAILFTVMFALGGGLPLFTLAWIGNRLIQSLGWPAMVQVSSRWFSFSRYGAVMGVISLSFLFGDAASRQFMSWLIEAGLGWRGVYFVAAAVLGVLFVAALLFLRGSPQAVGEPEPRDNPYSLIPAGTDSAAQDEKPEGSPVAALLRSPAFLLVCALSFGFTLLRETFNEWTPTFYTEAIRLSAAAAARNSALFPLLGGISVLIAGVLGDRLGRNGRALILTGGLALTAGLLLLLSSLSGAAGSSLPVVVVALIGFVMLGPYSYLAGALSLDFGGKRAGATASGIIDGVGYLGGVLAGKQVAQLSVAYGWRGAFLALAGVAAGTCVAALLFVANQRRLTASAQTSAG